MNQVLINENKMKDRKSSQAGFSLVELMIASVLGVFILGGVITSFTGTKDSEVMRSAVSEMDANARTAIEILRKTISLAGYPSMRNIQGFHKPFYSEIDEADDFTKGSINRSCGSVLMNISGATPGAAQYTSDGNRGDVLTAVYLADNPCSAGNATCPDIADTNPKAMVYTDCTGGGALRDARTVSCSTDGTTGMPSNALHAKIYNTFYLGSGSDSRTLYCQGSRGGSQPLVENIEYLQFLYGVTRADGATEYLSATDVEANNEWSQVTSVRVGLLIRSSNENVLKKASKKTNYILLNRKVKVTELRRLYRVYTTTIALPNRNRG